MKAGTDREAGYTYIAALVAFVAVAAGAQVATVSSQSPRIRNAEAELLFRGAAYQRAIESFYRSGGAKPRLPRTLSDLIADPRTEGLRHIRRLYHDPMTGGDFNLLYAPGGGIVGVASRSTKVPRRRAFFGEMFSDFADAKTYADWEFRFSTGD